MLNKLDNYSAVNVRVFNVEVSALDRYVRSASVCNTLALLVSQGSMIEFLQRISLLIRLQNCWTNGHTNVKLLCSSQDDCHNDIGQLSLEELPSDNNLLLPVLEETAASACNSDGNYWELLSCKCIFRRIFYAGCQMLI